MRRKAEEKRMNVLCAPIIGDLRQILWRAETDAVLYCWVLLNGEEWLIAVLMLLLLLLLRKGIVAVVGRPRFLDCQSPSVCVPITREKTRVSNGFQANVRVVSIKQNCIGPTKIRALEKLSLGPYW